MITIYDVAKELNLNPSTVSRAFKNPEMVSEKTRKRIFETAERLGYYPNLVASLLRTSRSNLIGVLVVTRRKSWNWYCDMFLSGADTVANENGYSLMTIISDVENYKNDVDLFIKLRFAGIVIVSTEILDIDYDLPFLIPTVFVNQSNFKGPNILSSDYEDSRVEMEYLIGLGHKKIAFIKGREDSPHTIERFRAYCDIMRENNLEVKPEWIGKSDNWNPHVAYGETKRILRCDERPTAIVASDAMAPGVYDAIRDMGLKIPDDVSVVGYDNQELSEIISPPLTTISFPLYEMGHRAINELITLFNSNDIEIKKHSCRNRVTHIRGELIVRESVLDMRNA